MKNLPLLIVLISLFSCKHTPPDAPAVLEGGSGSPLRLLAWVPGNSH